MEDTTSAYGTGLGCSPAATRPAKCAISTQNLAPTSSAIPFMALKSSIRGSAPAADDHGRVGFKRALADDFRIDAESFRIDSVGFGMVETSGEVDFHAVGEMSAMVEGKTEHGVARLDERLVDGCIGLCAGVRLHVESFGTNRLLPRSRQWFRSCQPARRPP